MAAAAPLQAIARDLLDIATGAGEIATTLEFVGRGLATAWEHVGEGERHRAKRVALRTLRRAAQDLAELIGDLQEVEP